MASLKKLQDTIKEYSARYRRADVDELEQGEVYSLDKSVDIRSTTPSLYWPATWPLSHRRGIYAIFSHEELLYIGKASQQAIGYRLSSYFKKVDGMCSIAQGHSWSSPPTHVVTWAVPDLMFFEASALEEYVIHQLKDELPDNTVGKNS